MALTTAGEDVQVDKAMIEMLVDPLTHIVRNSVDHGINYSGTASRRRQTRDRVDPHPCPADRHLAIIEVEDDGAGIDGARIRDKALGKGLIGAAEAASFRCGRST